MHRTKYHPLSERIVLDNERCILCSRCVRFTREISKTNALGIQERGDHSLVRASEDGAFEQDVYSDNVVDLCPVGALLSRSFLHRARVWYLEPTPSVCPGCSRGCTVNVWHRKQEWKLQALDPRKNTCIERVTPLSNPKVNGPWICNKGRDLAKVFERPRATTPMLRGHPVGAACRHRGGARASRDREAAAGPRVELGIERGARGLRGDAGRPHAGGREARLDADARRSGRGRAARARRQESEHRRRARALRRPGTEASATPTSSSSGAKGWTRPAFRHRLRSSSLGSYASADAAAARIFIPISIQTERDGHYTNFEGIVSAFARCFPSAPSVADAEALFALLAAREGVPA